MSYRFFGKYLNGSLNLSEDDVFHLTKVLRIRTAEVIEVVADGHLFECSVASFNPFSLTIISEKSLLITKKPEVTLLYALPKGDKLDLVIQKAVELGVSNIILVETTNAVVKFKEQKSERKLERLEKIVKSAAMQSRADIIPTISGVISFKEMLALPYGLKLIAHELAKVPFATTITNVSQYDSLAFFVGPEGGFTPKEVNLAQENGFKVVSFGKNILRSETAVLYGLSVIKHYKETQL